MDENDFAQLEALRNRYKDKSLSADAEAFGYREAARVLSERIARYEAALEAIIALENVDAAQDMEGSIDFWDGVDTGLSACQQIARKALEGGK